MIITEYYRTREDGAVLYRSFSSEGMMIIQKESGKLYSEAVDPGSMKREYIESTQPVNSEVNEIWDLQI